MDPFKYTGTARAMRVRINSGDPAIVYSQPMNDPYFIHELGVTQFDKPTRDFGTLAFLAHNPGGQGELFPGAELIEVEFWPGLGPGQVVKYKVMGQERYIALDPKNPHSLFVDPHGGVTYTAK